MGRKLFLAVSFRARRQWSLVMKYFLSFRSTQVTNRFLDIDQTIEANDEENVIEDAFSLYDLSLLVYIWDISPELLRRREDRSVIFGYNGIISIVEM